MKEQIQNRLDSLKVEFNSKEQELAETERKAAELNQTLLRIRGAIQVLEELLLESEKGEPNG